jgi:hypothetical protein
MTMSRVGYKHSDSTKKKIGDGNRGKERSPEFIAFLKSRVVSEETKQKLRAANLGKKASEETKIKMGNSNKGKRLGYKTSDEVKQKQREAHLGKKMPESLKIKLKAAHTGRKCSDETKEKMRVSALGRTQSESCKQLLREINTGKKHTEETRKKMGASRTGCKNYNWMGGISFEPYCPKFNRGFKERVRKFYGYKCVACGKQQTKELLHIHHVNYDKMVCCNDIKPLFVALCRSCHMKTNFNREYWEKFFTDIINEKYGGKCYV